MINLKKIIIINNKLASTESNEFNEKYAPSKDTHGNLIKAKSILKKALVSVSDARASISKSDKTFLCDKNYV